MACMHGLDDNNCPICRMSSSIFPINPINKPSLNKNALNSFNHFFKNKLSGNMDFEDDITVIKSNIRPNLINDFPKPNLINSVPTFENSLFLERINDLSIEKPNDLGISKKILLENPELNLEEE
ncbi:MAG: hypothetical protein KGD66_03220 [Candidatus Lokiarchaeota archaeon]|nr:hypothetical protein [Candidatus Lokiarchaeota archaeon]